MFFMGLGLQVMPGKQTNRQTSSSLGYGITVLQNPEAAQRKTGRKS